MIYEGELSPQEIIAYRERVFGLSKTIKNGVTSEKIVEAESELVEMLQKYKTELKIVTPIPRIRTWVKNNQITFMFYDKKTDKRVLLGDWLANKTVYYEY